MAIDKKYNAIQLAYRAKFLKLQQLLGKEYDQIATELDKQIKAVIDKHINTRGIIKKSAIDEINRELDKVARWFTLAATAWLDKNISQSINFAATGQDAAAMYYIKALIAQNEVAAGALKNYSAAAIKQQFGGGLSEAAKAIRDQIWQQRWADGYRLSDRIWVVDKTLRGNLHSMIEQCVNQGVSAVEFSRAVENYLEVSGTKWTTAIKRSITNRGTIKYNALRLARTETNNAYRTTHALGAKDSNMVKGIKWNLSKSHSKEDICDVWATQDLYGLGPGVYPPDKLPPGHPNCLCYLTDVLFEGEELIKVLAEEHPADEPDKGDEADKVGEADEADEIDKEIAGTEYLGKIDDFEYLGGGASETYTGIVNGKKYVFKADEPADGLNMLSSNVEGEILASKILNEFGLPAPKVKYGMFDADGSRKRLMAFDFVEDGIDVGVFLRDYGYNKVNLEQFRQMQVVDLLIGNGDRHNGNFFFLDDGSIIPIDHNLAFATSRIIDPDVTWQKCFLDNMSNLESHQTPQHILLRNQIGRELYKREGIEGYGNIIGQIQQQLTDKEIEYMVNLLPSIAADADRKKELIETLKWRRNSLQKLLEAVNDF